MVKKSRDHRAQSVNLLDDFAGFDNTLNFVDNGSAHAHYAVLLAVVEHMVEVSERALSLRIRLSFR